MNVQTITIDPVDGLLNKGLKNLWYAVCPSDFVKTQPVSVRRFGRKIALWRDAADRKSTRLNSSHTVISYAVFCLKKNKNGMVADTARVTAPLDLQSVSVEFSNHHCPRLR